MTWTPTNSHTLKQSSWLRTDHSGGCWQLVALCTRRAACRRRRKRRTVYCWDEHNRCQKVSTPNSWNHQVADRQADGQSKLPTLSTNKLNFPTVALAEADLKGMLRHLRLIAGNTWTMPPDFGVILHLCLHLLMQNDLVRKGKSI